MKIGVGIVQFEAKRFDNRAAFLAQAESYVHALSAYKPDFILFPEYFSLCLAANTEGSDWELLTSVALDSAAIVEHFSFLSKKFHVNIIAGTLPVLSDYALQNVSYFCHRDGRTEAYAKTHLTPFERTWQLTAGNVLKTIETDKGRVGILICYDCEFPEAARKMALDGAKILFVPYQTDTEFGHQRVRKCAAARAIENECYVVTAGLVGNMPELSLVEMQFAQSAVFTPCDFFFPHDGILHQAAANLPTAIFTELDLSLLERLHTEGSVQTLRDRRKDIY